jgi:AcrR family transcriptional regulator
MQITLGINIFHIMGWRISMNIKAEKILNTTIKLFIHEGVKKTTMDEIAEKANVSKVTIYKYFIDKDTLYL